ncbi:MAG: apolipoprotein N-acyltransferase [Candidatus Delongbacteria bacterium]|nr:apolipoprotein N-acyltransferase [Candidatus Delongbacteria bacterium]
MRGIYWRYVVMTALGLTFSFPPFSWPGLPFVALIPALLLFEQAIRDKRSILGFFLNGWWIGFLLSWATLFWIYHVTWVGLVPLMITEAAYYGLIFGLAGYLAGSCRTANLLILMAAWNAVDYLRSQTFIAFPWNLLGATVHYFLSFIQVADLGGIWLVGTALFAVNILLYLIWKDPAIRKNSMVLLVLLFLMINGYGYYRIATVRESRTEFKLGLIQGNINQDQKWTREFLEITLDKYLSFSRRADSLGADLIVWPETAAPCYLRMNALYWDGITRLTREIKKPLYTGTLDYENSKVYNTAFGFSETGALIYTYNKIRLVPFGERIPFSDQFPWLNAIDFGQGAFDYGTEYKLAEFRGRRFPTPICYEIIFPDLIRRFVNQGSDFLVTITNDAWFGRYSAPYQHAYLGIFRAVENRIGVARVANTGLTFFVSPIGRIEHSTRIFEDDVRVGSVCLKGDITLYQIIGDAWPQGLWLGLAVLLILRVFRRRPFASV